MNSVDNGGTTDADAPTTAPHTRPQLAPEALTANPGTTNKTDRTTTHIDDSAPRDDPAQHVAWSATCSNTPTPLPTAAHQLQDDLNNITTMQGIQRPWTTRAARIIDMCNNARQENDENLASCHPAVRAVLKAASPQGANVTGLAKCLQHIRHPDVNLAGDLFRGLDLVGQLPTTGLWDLQSSPPPPSTDHIRSAPSLSNARVQAALAHPPEGEAVTQASDIWRQTKVDIELGRLSTPTPISADRRGPLTVRFGVQQVTSKGTTKIRCIDDFKASDINGHTTSNEKVHHNHLDDLVAVGQLIGQHHHQPKLIKGDFKGAYRTVPINPDHHDLAGILVFDTDLNRWVTTTQHALPFGALSAVYGWERVGAALVAILRSIGLPALRYVDDIFMAVPHQLGSLARTIMEDVIQALGWHLEPDKTEGPTQQLTVLGVSITIDNKSIALQPDPIKVAVWLRQMQECIDQDIMHASTASKLAGRLTFAGQSIFGRVGRAHVRPIYDRIYTGHSALDPALRHSLLWWIELLQTTAYRRTAPLQEATRPAIVIYTDATGDGRIGSAIYRNGELLNWSASKVPPELDDVIHQRQTQVNLYELYAII